MSVIFSFFSASRAAVFAAAWPIAACAGGAGIAPGFVFAVARLTGACFADEAAAAGWLWSFCADVLASSVFTAADGVGADLVGEALADADFGATDGFAALLAGADLLTAVFWGAALCAAAFAGAGERAAALTADLAADLTADLDGDFATVLWADVFAGAGLLLAARVLAATVLAALTGFFPALRAGADFKVFLVAIKATPEAGEATPVNTPATAPSVALHQVASP